MEDLSKPVTAKNAHLHDDVDPDDILAQLAAKFAAKKNEIANLEARVLALERENADLKHKNSIIAELTRENSNLKLRLTEKESDLNDAEALLGEYRRIASKQAQSFNSPVDHRRNRFLQDLASLMAERGRPLPQSLTGIPSPSYDPRNSLWTFIKPSRELGSFILAGKDVDLFKLWSLVFQRGGRHAVNNANEWGTILCHFDLPEHFAEVQANNSTSVALMLSQFYTAILYPFEELYMKRVQQRQKKDDIFQELQYHNGNNGGGS